MSSIDGKAFWSLKFVINNIVLLRNGYSLIDWKPSENENLVKNVYIAK